MWKYLEGKRLESVAVVAFSLLILNCAVAADQQDPVQEQISRALYAADRIPQTTGNWHLGLEGMWMYGPVSGHVQTPSGGRPGTTSSNRPSFGEIGINTASIYDAEVLPSFRDHGMYIGGQWIRLSGDKNLEETLISQGETFAAGSRVNSDVKLDWYRIGYRYRIQRGDEAGAELPNTEIYSRLGAAILDFHYQLDGAGATEADRSYIKAAPQMGVEMEWHASDRISLAGEITSTLPFSGIPWIVTTQLEGKFKLFEKKGMGLGVVVGAGYEKIQFHDHQDASNEINADFGPLLRVGLELRM